MKRRDCLRPRGAGLTEILVAVLMLVGCSAPADQAATTPEQSSDHGVQASPTIAAAQPSPNPSVAPLTFQMTCPAAYTGSAMYLDSSFGYDIEGAQTFVVRIDFGDVQDAVGDQDHLGEVFAHRYYVPGRHVVAATVIDSQGRTAAATCTADWTLPDLPALPESSSGSGSGGLTALCNDGTLTAAAGVQGACAWHGGLSGSGVSGAGVGGGGTWVNGYTRSDGTYVHGYVRRTH